MKNTFVKVLSMMMALMMIVGILTAIPVYAADDECDHVKASETPVKEVAPTCAKPGYKSYLCAICKEQFIPEDEVILPSEEYHNIQTVDPVVATCLTDAYTGGKRCVNEGCPNVEDTYEGIVRQEGTQKEHSFKKEVKAATCVTAGVEQYRCTTCNYTAEQLSGRTGLGVDFNKDDVVDSKDCKLLSTQPYESWDKTDLEGAKDPNHEDLVWTVVTAPVKGNATTRCADGLAKGVCPFNCGFTKTAVIPAHEFTKQINPSNSTCSDYKDTAMQCKNCFAPDPSNNADDMWKAEEKTQHGVGDGAIAKKFNAESTEKLEANKTYYRSNGNAIKYEEFVKAGVTVGTPFVVEATCTTPGKMLVECACGELVYRDIPATGHTYDGMTDNDWNAVDVFVWATDCATPSYKKAICENEGCDKFITKKIQDAANPNGHEIANLEEVVVDATCVAMGYTYEKCTFGKFTRLDGTVVECKHQTDPHDYTQQLEHVYGPVVLKKDAKCGDADGYVQYCTQANKTEAYKDKGYVCGHEKAAAVPEGAAHKYGDWQTVPGTCVTASTQYRTCSVCENKEWNDKFVGTTNAAKHEYSHYGWEGNGSAPTCTSSRVELVWCTKCSTDEAKQLATVKKGETKYAPHTIVENIYAEKVENVLYIYGAEGTGDATHVYKGKDTDGAFLTKEVDCKTDGYKNNGKYCVVCGFAEKPAEKIAKETVFNNIKKHQGYTADLKPTNSTEATCTAGATETYVTTCCGLITITVTKKLDGCVYTKPVPATKPTCTTDGNHFHYVCKFCDAYKAGSVTTDGCTLNCANHYAIEQGLTNNVVIGKLGHDKKVMNATKPANCNSSSLDAYEYCSRCDLRWYDGEDYIYNADPANAKDVEAFNKAIVIPAHGTKYNQTFDAVPATCYSKGVNGSRPFCTVCEEGDWIIDEIPHTEESFYANDPSSPKYDCTKASVKVTSCMKCDWHKTENYVPAKAAHEYNKYGAEGKNEWNPIGLEPNTSHCTAPTYKEKTCKFCGVEAEGYRVVVVDEAPVGHYVMEEGDRVDISWKCTEIANFIGKKCAECKVTVTAANIAALSEHTIVPKEKAPTCTEEGYLIEYCSACNTTDPSVYKYEKIDKIGNKKNHVQGTVLEMVPATATTDGYVKYICAVAGCGVTATDKIPATATLVVSGAVSANKVTASNDVTYTVTYSGVAQTFKTIKIEVKFDANKFDFDSASSALTENVFTSVENGVVGITLVSKTDMTTAAEGTALVTLNFTAKKYAMGAAEFGVKTIVKVENVDTEVIIAKAATTVVGLGNATGTGFVTAEDALAILGTEEFNAEFDINGDGMVDLIDVALVGTFAASAQTAKDYLVMLGTYAEIQATIDALYADGKLADCNKDGIVTINDYYALIAEVDEKLADIGDYKNINFASVDEFVMNTMRDMIITRYPI